MIDYGEKKIFESEETITPLPILGHTIIHIDGLEEGSSEVVFHCSDGRVYKMYHEQDCCESVTIDDIVGNISDLIGSELVQAEEFTKRPSSGDMVDHMYADMFDSITFTFYNFATKSGYVQIKWFGESNGYYSESVTFEETRYCVSPEYEEYNEALDTRIRAIYNDVWSSNRVKTNTQQHLLLSDVCDILQLAIDIFDKERRSDIVPHIALKCPTCGHLLNSVVVRDMAPVSLDWIFGSNENKQQLGDDPHDDGAKDKYIIYKNMVYTLTVNQTERVLECSDTIQESCIRNGLHFKQNDTSKKVSTYFQCPYCGNIIGDALKDYHLAKPVDTEENK